MLLRTNLAKDLKGKFIFTTPSISLKTVTGDKTTIHLKLNAIIKFGSRMFKHRVYVAGITDQCILEAVFL